MAQMANLLHVGGISCPDCSTSLPAPCWQPVKADKNGPKSWDPGPMQGGAEEALDWLTAGFTPIWGVSQWTEALSLPIKIKLSWKCLIQRISNTWLESSQRSYHIHN